MTKKQLKELLYLGFHEAFERSLTTNQGADPNEVINNVSNSMADVIADAIDSYLSGNDVFVTQEILERPSVI